MTELARLDGCFALRTDLPKALVPKDVVHDRYKDLAQVEWAFRDSKSVHLEMRPVYLRAENRTRGHAVVVMLAYLMAQELRRRWRDIDTTVQEALHSLAGLCVTEVRLGGRPSYHQFRRRAMTSADCSTPPASPSRPRCRWPRPE